MNLSDRIIMMHRGQILQDYRGEGKRRVRTGDLVERFEQVRRLEQLDESAAEVLARQYA